ncbi:hypothetical protein K435DRAFT_323792 [Dendrothele bispora CBS 962.96]|uniref:Family A G protein-coupled receptor-like protein n=1 Tax=Dendrothele bispora (strain CBS 962.96) TaxID=1314807 RepID=A0A4S8LGB0_DENBC|nr:hypothetical protein K435DRAFT_323792 [Dendrothele bispora CBS 962.96]
MSSQTPQSGPLPDSIVSNVVGWAIEMATTFLLYGVNIAISFTAMYLLTMTSPRMTKARIGLLSLTIFMLLMSTLSVSLNMAFILLEIPLISAHPPDVMSLLTNIRVVGIYVDRLNFLTCDGIVVWRAWILYPRSLVVKLLLVLCMIGSLAGTFVNVGFTTVEFLRDINSTGGTLEMLEQTLPLLFTNLISTSIIGYKAWCYQKELGSNLISTNGSVMRAQKILWFLVESGFFYCMFWIGFTVISALNGTGSESFQVYAKAIPLLSHMRDSGIRLILCHYRSRLNLPQGLARNKKAKAPLGSWSLNRPLLKSQEAVIWRRKTPP